MSDKQVSGEWAEVWLDAEVVEAFRATGPHWKELINAALSEWLKTHTPNEVKV